VGNRQTKGDGRLTATTSLVPSLGGSKDHRFSRTPRRLSEVHLGYRGSVQIRLPVIRTWLSRRRSAYFKRLEQWTCWMILNRSASPNTHYHSCLAYASLSSKAPVIRGARACTTCRQAKVRLHFYFLSHASLKHFADEMCRRRRWTQTLSALQTRKCRVKSTVYHFDSLLTSLMLDVCSRSIDVVGNLVPSE
jgi:hypothetical protein